MRILTIVVALIVSLPLSAYGGGKLYLGLCASCHHPQRIGKTAPPLLPPFLKRYSDADLKRIIRDGLPATQMPSFKGLSERQVGELIELMRKPVVVKWSEADIIESLELAERKGTPVRVKDIKNLTVVVERGKDKVWVMEEYSILDKFDFRNVHGGVKFALDGSRFFIPSRDGWVGRYDINRGFYGRVRPCVYLRNIALSRDGRYLIAACLLPQDIVILDAENIRPLRSIPLEGNISAIYVLYSRDEALFTFRDRPLLGVLDTKTLKIKYIKLHAPFEDFFIDPFERFVVGTSRRGTLLKVFDLEKGAYVFEYPIDGMPHLFSSSIWYNKGVFYFATLHMNRPYMTLWRMYDWAFVRRIDVGGKGFLVRTHANTPYLWIDKGSDELLLVDKRDLTVKTLIPEKGKKVVHTEFSGDGAIAYVSIYDHEGLLVLYDASTLEVLKRIPASLPAGKYNFVSKLRRYDPVQLGRQVFMTKCWGCHHQSREAFGPSFAWIASHRDKEIIKAQLLDPLNTSQALGYKRSAMPKIDLSREEMEAIISYIDVSGEGF